MLRRFSINFAIFSLCLDMVIILAMLDFAAFVRPSLNNLTLVAEMPWPVTIPLVLYLVFPILWVTILQFMSIYDGRKNFHVTDEMMNLTVGSFVAVIAQAGILYLTYRDLSRALFVVYAGSSFSLLIAWRLLVRAAYRVSWINTLPAKNILIVGAGKVGRDFEQQMNSDNAPKVNVIGFIDDDLDKQSLYSDVLGGLSDLLLIIREQQVDDVVIALPPRAYQKVSDLVTELHALPVKVWVIPDYYHLALHKAVVEELGGIPLLDLRAPALTDYQRFVKRSFDLIVTTLLLPFTAFFMGIIAVFIKLEDHGPVFFRQKRVGENGRLFEMLKFRTMHQGADKMFHLVVHEDQEGRLVYKDPNDPRITHIGRILRTWSLDELPQIINILKGEMSLVGPRPELPELVNKYEDWQRKRFTVPQGLTGWWQVNGRSDKPMHLHTEDDLYYVQNYSLFLDLQILWMTIAAVLRRKGAY